MAKAKMSKGGKPNLQGPEPATKSGAQTNANTPTMNKAKKGGMTKKK